GAGERPHRARRRGDVARHLPVALPGVIRAALRDRDAVAGVATVRDAGRGVRRALRRRTATTNLAVAVAGATAARDAGRVPGAARALHRAGVAGAAVDVRAGLVGHAGRRAR